MDIDNKEKPRAVILLVDDDPTNLVTLGHLLQPHYDVLAAPSGERALQIATAARKPDLILLDVLMPGMDGHARSPACATIPPPVTFRLFSSPGWIPPKTRRRASNSARWITLPNPTVPPLSWRG